jgi:hypothetical protein
MFKIRMADPSRTFCDPATGHFLSGAKTLTVDHLGALTKTWIQEGGIVCEEVKEAELLVETSTQKPAEPPVVTLPPAPEAPAPQLLKEPKPEEQSPVEEEEEEDAEPSLASLLTPAPSKKKR